ncbi:uncharacterized protein METZ01_LOCUS254168 [marine metagenome]|uniref:Uncharacterized protein n=1 Tax=marine metagenome TaxID=408172 RepID=A0A382ING7_9ZZZZ
MIGEYIELIFSDLIILCIYLVNNKLTPTYIHNVAI